MEHLFNNEMRAFFGLEPLNPKWDKFDMNGTTLYFEKDTIKKRVNYTSDYSIYSETDMNVETENREWILPTTKKGKNKKLDSMQLGKRKHKGVFFKIHKPTKTRGVHLEVSNEHNNLKIIIPLPDTINEFHDFIDYMPTIMKEAPSYCIQMFDDIKNLPKKTIRYKNGDIVRVALDWKTFAYALIIGRFSEYRKENLIPEDHPFKSLMTVPIVLRFFDVLSNNEKPTLEELYEYPLQSPVIVMDDGVLRNTYPVVLHKELEKEDILFPQYCSILYKSNDPNSNSKGFLVEDNDHLKHLVSLGYKPQLSLAWGFGIKTKYTDELLEELSPCDEYSSMSNRGIGGMYILNKDNKPYIPYSDFSNHPQRDTMFHYFGLDPDISFDEFNKEYNGYTREDYLKLIEK